MLRPAVRCGTRVSRRWYGAKSPISVAFSSGDQDEAAARYRNQKNPVIPSIANLAVRWPRLDAGKQDDIIAYLEDKMRGDWHAMSAEEKRAAHYVWYGNWGPRADRATDMSGIYTLLAGAVAVTCLGLVAYKYATFDANDEIPGLDYRSDDDK